jgi:hypothetical protein
LNSAAQLLSGHNKNFFAEKYLESFLMFSGSVNSGRGVEFSSRNILTIFEIFKFKIKISAERENERSNNDALLIGLPRTVLHTFCVTILNELIN